MKKISIVLFPCLSKTDVYIYIQYVYRSDIDSLQFQMTFEIPHIRVRAKYQSSGVLILVKASGAGDYWGEYGIYSIILYFSLFLSVQYINSKPFKL